MSLEVELKLWVTAPMSAALLQNISESWSTLAATVKAQSPVTLLNAYFETPAQWFRRHDAGLRTRCKNGQYQQTIKLAGQQLGAAHVRPEYNQPCASVEPMLADFPAEIWPEGTDIAALQQQLQELFRTDFVRHCWLLTLQDGTRVEAVLDQGQVVANEQSQPLLEIELELIEGDPQQLFGLARQLLQRLPLCLGFQSKAERGYRLAQQTPLQLAPVSLDPSLSCTVLLRQLQQNLWLATCTQNNHEIASFQQAIAQQWLQLQSQLAEASAADTTDQVAMALQSRAVGLQLTQSEALSLWLLDFSSWLLNQPAGSI
jgi:triphosphatase